MNSVQTPQRSGSRSDGGSGTARHGPARHGSGAAAEDAVLCPPRPRQGRRPPAAAAGMLPADTVSAQWNSPGKNTSSSTKCFLF